MELITNPKLIDKNKWAEFVSNHPNGNIFQTYEMFEVYENTKNYKPIFVAIINNNKIESFLLAVIQKENYGLLSFLTSRSIIIGGPLIKDNDLNSLNSLLIEYNKLIKKKAIYTQFRNLWEWKKEEKEVFCKNGFNYEEHLDILINIRKSEDELLKEMHKGRRKNIGRAERIPLTFSEIENSNDFEKCLVLIKQTYKRIKMPCPDLTLFNNASEILSNKFYLKKIIVKYQNEIIACRFILCYNKLIYDWYAGTNESHQDKYPNDFIVWKILQWAKETCRCY